MSEHLRTEACLEAALVAALEDSAVFAALAAHLGWSFPTGQPTITTQDAVTAGRTDVMLTWPSSSGAEPYRIVLELKVDAPPDADQVEKYLGSGADVIAIARFQRRIQINTINGKRFRGTTTWRRIRELKWSNGAPPLQLLQLHELLDATGVIMPNVSLPGLMGIVSSWHAWVTFREWSKRAANTIAEDYCASGHNWVVRAGTKGRVGFEESYERYAARLWPPPMRKDWLKIYVGIFTGRPDDPTLVDGVPDFFFALHVDPKMLFGQQLQTDAEFKAAVKAWQKRKGGEPMREYNPGEWEVLRARSSALQLAQAQDQERVFVEWMQACAQEWRSDGIVAAIAKLDVATRSATGKATENDE